jgi:hypothetical protein
MGAQAVECRADGITNGSVSYTPSMLLTEMSLRKVVVMAFLDAQGIFLIKFLDYGTAVNVGHFRMSVLPILYSKP